MCVRNFLQVAMCIAPILNTNLSLRSRAEVALEGYLCMQLFQCFSQKLCREIGLPTGSCSMAAQTARNLEAVALSALVLTVTKEAEFEPWRYSNARLSELPVEQWFSYVRSQSVNSQHTCRSYWKASARQALRTSKQLHGQKPLPDKGEKCLTESQLLGQIWTGVLARFRWAQLGSVGLRNLAKPMHSIHFHPMPPYITIRLRFGKLMRATVLHKI